MTTVAVHQPDFAPYLGFFRKMAQCDVFILYDTAQFSKNGFHNRNRIKTPSGTTWLTVPVRSPHFRPIIDVEPDNTVPWGAQLWRSLEANYARASHFHEISSDLRPLFVDRLWTKMVDFNRVLIEYARRVLGLGADLRRASDLRISDTPNPTDRLIEMVQAVGGDQYLSGPMGRTYLDVGRFRDVKLAYAAPYGSPYPQLWGPFVPNLSVLDALFNCGQEIAGTLRQT